MAGRVQLDVESYAMRHSIDGRRRVIAEALRAAHARGLDEMSVERDARPACKDVSQSVDTLNAEIARLRRELARERGLMKKVRALVTG
jgi:hypothetical protein